MESGAKHLEKNVTVTGGCRRRGGSGQGRRTREMAFSKWGTGRNAGERQGCSGRGYGGQDGYAKVSSPGWEAAGKNSFWMATHIRRMSVARKRSEIAGSSIHKANAHSCGRFEPPRPYAQACAQGIWHSMRSCLKGDDGAFCPGQGLLGNSLLCGLHIPREFLTQRRRFANFPRNWRLFKLLLPFSNSLQTNIVPPALFVQSSCF